MPPPLIAIVGAPNVGKSTLFNRLVGRRRAIVTDEPGATRDRLYGSVRDAAVPLDVVDTGGLTPGDPVPYADEIEHQAELALDQARVVLFVVDARAGITALDRELASRLRRRGADLLLVANKVDGPGVEPHVLELHELGLGTVLPISAAHGKGIDELLAAVVERLDASEIVVTEPGSAAINVAIVGRPNVGKSSLVNRLLGEQRVVVSALPGTTRDAIDTPFQIGARRYRLIDTAGLRRPGRIQRGVEHFSVDRAHKAVERADVAILVLDASVPLAAQDTHIAGLIRDTFKPMVVALNKWDLADEREAQVKVWTEEVAQRLRFVKEVPLVFVSALSGQRVTKILDHVDAVHAAAGIRVGTPELNRWLEGLSAGDPRNPPPRGSCRLYYATQTGIRPPRFLFFCNDPSKLHFSLQRRLENGLRERFGFGPAPLRLEFRRRREPRE